MEFTGFNKIENYKKVHMVITQKIHGSNAQIYIEKNDNGQYQIGENKYNVLVGSRNRWITPESDNFGFAQFVYSNVIEIIEKLGVGKHFGEWAGPGINSGEGLSEKTFVLFDHHKFPSDRPLPARMVVVPVLYKGKLDANKVDEVMEDLKLNGSKLVKGFMRPEGVVIEIAGNKFKQVFEPEETQWKGVKKEKVVDSNVKDYSFLLQPIRLEKLLSKDERFIKEYPGSMTDIIGSYFKDLLEENQIESIEERTARKQISRPLVSMIQEIINK